jgi:hypothetical protein
MSHDGPWPEADVSGLERGLGVVLPAGFRQYLQQDGTVVLGAEEMVQAFGFLSTLGERLLGRPLRLDEPFPVTAPDVAKLLVHYQRHEAGTGLDRLLFPCDGWLPIIAHGPGFSRGQPNACDVLVTAGAFRGCVLYADYGYRWWWPYLSSARPGPAGTPAVMSFTEFSHAHLAAAAGPARTPRPWCPRCGVQTVPVLYGRTGSAAVRLAQAGAASLGGCVISPASPRWSCPQCYAGFGQLAGMCWAQRRRPR